ncbi:MAG: glycosyltransferase family protein [Paracoccaceae bacterium]
MKVLIAVTHLLGTGHLSRALTLARAFAASGHKATIVSGGFPAHQLRSDGVDLIQLPPLRSDGVNFTRLLTDNGSIADDVFLTTRTKALIGHLRNLQPDVLITELYPFGRRVLSSEFLALLDAAHNLPKRPVVLASIRDILAPPSKPSKAARADEVIAAYYDAVLVHSDPKVTKLETSWPVSAALEEKLRYTGFVAPSPPPPHPENAGSGEIIVSAGGGSVGTAIFETAAKAAHLMPMHRWRILVGGADTEESVAKLRSLNTPALIEPARPDFRQMLGNATASVSMCGYNTVMDLLQTGTPAVLVPFDAGGEVEQGLRANSLRDQPGIEVLRSADLTPETLHAHVEKLLTAPQRDTISLNFDGAEQTVTIATEMVGQT